MEVFGIDGGHEPISWASIREMEKTTANYGISKENWPIYREYEIDTHIPFKDAENRSAKLRTALARLDDEIVRENYWLSMIQRILREGNSFFIMP